MIVVYEYKIKNLFKAPAQVAGEVCEALEKSTVGLSPRSLLDASRHVNAPLHGEFEWDDSVAAENYRESQAATIIRNIYVVRADKVNEEVSVRAFVSATSETKVGRYHNIQAVIEDDAMKAHLLNSALRDCRSFIDKYKRLAEMQGVVDAMKLVV